MLVLTYKNMEENIPKMDIKSMETWLEIDILRTV
jgi:hypothetical protein